ncbi:MAG: hypothetical protein K2O18_14740, partial [Oscillospiraceae bacterium]|nr:hypothetical protein [Oscillospiraceae bacterium]
MSKIKNAARQLTAGLLCTAMTLSCFSGLSLTALAGDDENNRETISQWNFESDLEGWYYGDGWDSSYHGNPCTVTAENGMLRLDVDYSHDGDNSWAQVAVCSWSDPGQDFSGADCMRLDVIYETDRLTDGELKIKIYSGDAGVDKDLTLDTSAAKEIGSGQSLVSTEITFNKISASAVKDWAVCVIGCNTTYSGSIWLDNISVLKSTESEQPPVQPGEELPVTLTFDKDINGWSAIDGYNYQPGQCGIDWEDGMLRLNVDYSGNAGEDWSEAKIKYDNETGLPLRGANTLTMDVIFDPAALDGTLKIKFSSDSANISGVDAAVNIENAFDFGIGLKKSVFKIDFYPIASDSITDWTLGIVGSKTSYQGPVYLDNITFSAADVDDIYVDATVDPADDREIFTSGGMLVTYTQDGKEIETGIPSTIKMVDSNADASARKLYAYLLAVGESKSAIFGHQDSTWQKAGSGDSWSDIYDVTGSYAGIVGFDTLSLVGNEYNVNEQHNKMFPDQALEDTPENRVRAAAVLANWNIEQGAIVTLSSHTPNFSNIRRLEAQNGDPSYAAYDFSVYTPNDLTGDVANEILPGGAYNTEYNAFLDLIADFAHQVDGAILFRPFHENTGSWFWWGKAFCDAETYKNIFRYTVEYLRDEKDVHNLIYVYGPGSEAESLAEYEERYPGDAYVDMVGFDMYHTSPRGRDDLWIGQFIKELELVCDFAVGHGKLAAVTETGAAEPDLGDTPDKALRRSGNEYKDWYQDILDIVSESSASYFLVWANFGESSGGFYTPYVKSVNNGVKHGHEMMDYFINFFNDPRSIFASNQQDVLTRGSWDITVENSEDVTGYIVSPVGGRRILEETDLVARITGSPEAVTFRLTGTANSITLNATQSTGTPYYYAKLTAAALTSLGESATGTISLLADGVLLSEQNE